MRILIFGGTGDARKLANQLVASGHDVTSSLAGRTNDPLLPQGQVRSGGFGGVAPLATYFSQNRFDWIVDATHPFADGMSRQVITAAEQTHTPFLRLQRPPWDRPKSADWIDVTSINAALDQLVKNARVLVTSGHKNLDALAQRPDCTFLVRLIEEPKNALPANCELMLARPPFTLPGEKELMRTWDITHLLSKNSGGSQTRAKIDAAHELNIPVYMVQRPTGIGGESVSSIEAALAKIHEVAT